MIVVRPQEPFEFEERAAHLLIALGLVVAGPLAILTAKVLSPKDQTESTYELLKQTFELAWEQLSLARGTHPTQHSEVSDAP